MAFNQSKRAMQRRRSSGAEEEVPEIKAWSFSRLNNWERCPRKARYLYVDKLDEVKGEPLIRGTRIHKECEKYLLGDGPITHDMRKFKKEFKELRKLGAEPESQWAFDKDWQPCSWFAAQTWARMSADANYEVNERAMCVIDFKTGKMRDAEVYRKQVELYALALGLTYDVDTVHVELWFLDAGRVLEEEHEITEEALAEGRLEWERTVRPMLQDRLFIPKPSQMGCGYCSFSCAEDGPCKDAATANSTGKVTRPMRQTRIVTKKAPAKKKGAKKKASKKKASKPKKAAKKKAAKKAKRTKR